MNAYIAAIDIRVYYYVPNNIIVYLLGCTKIWQSRQKISIPSQKLDFMIAEMYDARRTLCISVFVKFPTLTFSLLILSRNMLDIELEHKDVTHLTVVI